MQEIRIIADESMNNVRVDKALLNQVDFSRTRLQQLIEEGCLEVNGEVCKSNYKVKVNDEIVLEVPEVVEYTVKPYPMDLDIRYEDDDKIKE